jgi:hypothetical protein
LAVLSERIDGPYQFSLIFLGLPSCCRTHFAGSYSYRSTNSLKLQYNVKGQQQEKVANKNKKATVGWQIIIIKKTIETELPCD